MNWLLISAAVIAAVTTLIHAILGGRDVAGPLLKAQTSEEVKLTMYACWHLVTSALGLSAIALLLAGVGFASDSSIGFFVGALWLAFGLVFLFVTLVIARPSGLFRFPQWVLLLPVGALAIAGSL